MRQALDATSVILQVARGEAMECAASIDVMRLRKLINDARYVRGIQLLEGVVAMLIKML